MKTALLFGLVLVAVGCAVAQDTTRIDGRQHPELVPDNAAYRAVFLMHSHFETQEDTARSEQFHAMISLSPADHQLYDDVLKNFRQQYETLIRTHDAYIDANTSSASITDLRKEVSETRQSLSRLVDATRSQLKAGMSTDGMAKLNSFVQRAKTRMVVGTRSAQ